MKRIIAVSALLLAGCSQAKATTAPAVKHGTITGFEQIEISETYTEEFAILTDSCGQDHRLSVSDAMIGDEYTIRHGVITEKTYEGSQDDNEDYYIVELENGDLHEVEADDLLPGDEVTVYFYEDRAIRTRYGWK